MVDRASTKGGAAQNVMDDAAARASELASRALETLNSALIVTQPEPAQRSKSYREIILQEMNWMASDYYHERRWKQHIAKQICIGIHESIMEKKRMNKNWVANECSVNMKRFWAGILAKNIDSSVVSEELLEYCNDFGKLYRSHLQTEIGSLSGDYYIGEKDLIAISVPPPSKKETTVPNTSQATVSSMVPDIELNDVLEATLYIMQSMGADFYSPIFRPPDDDMDMFTMPLMDPVRDEDFNALLVQHFFLKHNDQVMSISQGKPVEESPAAPVISRKFNRQGNVASCLAVSVRDFDLQLKPKPAFKGPIIKTRLTPIDLELLDPWMFTETPSWPMLAICISYRSGTSGLYRFEYSAKYCKRLFYNLKKQSRGLVNATRRLLGPRQRNAVNTFLESPLPKENYKPVAAYTTPRNDDDDKGSQVAHRTIRKGPGSGKLHKRHNLNGVSKSIQKGSLEASVLLFKSYLANGSIAAKGVGNDVGPESSDVASNVVAKPYVDDNIASSDNNHGELKPEEQRNVQTETEIHLPFADSLCTHIGDLPVTLLQRVDNSNILGRIKQTLSRQRQIVLEEVPADKAKGEVIALPENVVVEVDITRNKRDRQFYVGDGTTEPVFQIKNMPYGDYSNRLSKQLKVGFMGIPSKIFAHSLFYSGRFCKNSRVRRVAVTISNASKVIMPQPNMLYGRLFEHDMVAIFGQFRNPNLPKPQEYSADQHADQLLKTYTSEIMVHSPSKKAKIHTHPDLQTAEMLATYVGIKLSQGDVKPQGSITHEKIPVEKIEQVVPSVQPQQNIMEQTKPPQVQGNMPIVGTAPPPHSQWQGHSIPMGIQQTHTQHQNAPMGQQSITSSPMQMRPLHFPPMHRPQQMMPSQIGGCQVQHGQMTPGTMTPNQMSHGQLTPGSMQHGHMTPGSMTPNHMPQMKMPPTSITIGQMPQAQMSQGQIPQGQMPQAQMPQAQMPGPQPSPMHQPQMHGPPHPMQMQMEQIEQMKRRQTMDLSGNRRPMMPYDQIYHPQVAMPQYRYRPMPDLSMMPMPLYPMQMYSKKPPYPKAHDEQYLQQQHMPR